MKHDVKTLLKSTASLLQTVSQTPRFDAEILLAHLLQKPEIFLHAWPDYVVDDNTANRFFALIEKRRMGWPVAYLTGIQPFWSLDLTVNQSTLIPRPETECLIELALSKLHRNTAYQIADLGTGSGAISLALAKELPDSQIFATDISEAALDVARLNARKLNINNVQFFQGSWCDALPRLDYDVIVSNPPYVARHESQLLSIETQFEPDTALFSDENGLKAIHAILTQALSYLKSGGFILIEHGFSQGKQVRAMFKDKGFTCVFTERDYSNHERVTGGYV